MWTRASVRSGRGAPGPGGPTELRAPRSSCPSPQSAWNKCWALKVSQKQEALEGNTAVILKIGGGE